MDQHVGITATAVGGGLRSALLGSAAGKAAELVTLVVMATVLPRALGPSDFGRFSVPLTVVTVGTAALALGGTTLHARFVPAAPLEQRRALARAVTLRLARARALQVGAVGAAAAVLVSLEPAVFPPLVTWTTFAALTVAVAATLGCQAGLGLGRTGAWSIRYPVHNALLIVAVLLLHPRWGVPGAVAALVVAAAGMLAVGAVAARGLLRAPEASSELPRAVLAFGRQQGLGWALTQLSQRGGVLVVAALASSSLQTGFAALALGTALPATYAVVQLFTVSLPHVAGDVRDGEARTRRLAATALAVVLAGGLLVAATLPRSVPLVFGADYADAARSFAPVLGLVVLSPLHALLVQSSALRLRAEVTSRSAVAGAVVFALVALTTVPSLGATGATAAATVGAATTTAVAVRGLPRAVGWPIGVTSFLGAAVVVSVGLVVTR